jgi:ATP-dependent Clp protease ATP-binding subunit ClpC
VEHPVANSGGRQTDRQRRARRQLPQLHHPDDLQRRFGRHQTPVHLGFSPISDEASYEKMRERIMDEAKKTFRPEFLNRLDDLIVFRSFTKPDLIQILNLEVGKVLERLRHKNIRLELDEKAKDFLVEKGYDPQYGARPMRRSVERFLEDPLAEEILKGMSFT